MEKNLRIKKITPLNAIYEKPNLAKTCKEMLIEEID